MSVAGPEHDVVVVGAGITGLAVARDISDAGRSVLVLEARERQGGRLDYREFPAAGRSVEMGGAWVSTRFHPYVVREMERYGLEVVHEPDFSWLWSLDTDTYAPGFPIEGDDLYDLERAWVDAVIAARRIEREQRRDEQGGLEDLDVSFEEWVSSLGLSPRVAKFLFMGASIGMGASERDYSTLSVISLLAGMDCSPLGYIAAAAEKFSGGTASLLAALAAAPGTTVQLGTAVMRVHQHDDHVELTTNRGTVRARQVVWTTPVNCWAHTEFVPALSPAKSRLAAQTHPNRMVKLHMLIDTDPGDIFTLGRETDLLCVATQYRTEAGTVLVGFASAPRTFRPDTREDVERALGQVLPDATLIDYVWHDWNADPWSRGTWMAYPPGHLATSASEIAATEGRVAFAGSDLATTWIGWMEGALESGARAAAETLAALEESPTG